MISEFRRQGSNLLILVSFHVLCHFRSKLDAAVLEAAEVSGPAAPPTFFARDHEFYYLSLLFFL